jgi:hypothetical protein
MRKPEHIILNFEYSNSVVKPNYWAVNHLISTDAALQALTNSNVHLKFKKKNAVNHSHGILKSQQKFTVRSSHSHPADFLYEWERSGITQVYAPTALKRPHKHVLGYSRDKGHDFYAYINLTDLNYNRRNVEYLLARYSPGASFKTTHKLNTWFSLVNVNLLRKERLYTKLKYSRSPAFDIVSGGAAALLAGFVGFLISEKFGYEMVDSGDFYYLFMYLVFLSFSIRPLLIVADSSKGFADLLSLSRVWRFYSSLVQLFLFRGK